jgi:hypothetical protein
MTDEAARRWPALLPADTPDATIAALRVSHAAPIFEAVVACTDCGVRQTLWGPCRRLAARPRCGSKDIRARPALAKALSGSDEREPVRLPGIG